MKPIDIDASNVVGLGASTVATNIIQVIHRSSKLAISNVFLPPKNTLMINLSKELDHHIYKLNHGLFRRATRILRLFFPPKIFRSSSTPLLVLGDIPYRVNRPQLVFLHHPYLMRTFSWRSLSIEEFYYLFARIIFSLNSRFASCIFVQSDRAIDQLRPLYPRLACPIVKLPNPPITQLNDYLYGASAVKEHAEHNSLRLFYPASPYKHKNHSILRQINYTKLDFLRSITVTLNHGDVPGLSNPTINFTGSLSYKKTLEFYLSSTDALLFLSLDETLGLPLIEAMFFSLPIICPNRPYAKDLCGSEAIYFDPLSSTSLEVAIRTLRVKLSQGWKPNWTKNLENIRNEWDMFIPTLSFFI